MLLLGFIYFSKGRIAKEILDVTAKTVGIVAGSTIIYKNSVVIALQMIKIKKEKKDKNDKNDKTDDSKNETTSK